ncbi:cation transporter [Nocardioides eburneiflavus]|uniref:Cation transporter n=1 Tax=Nocardioides eburneiflavus TaxID=2518372 RepID=A0A4Z1CFW8_9ACTN|nr:cation diffusion facilitator family transporter [Nocardioides eburneiflavus]TGN65185.1 cation transporter [Nocardioides eburneiflavus]
MSTGHNDNHIHGHGHGHGHGLNALDAVNAGARYRRPLAWAFAITVAFVGVELAVGVLSGSLALLSDAGHMLSDAGGLGMSWAAITLATAGTAAAHRTYGWYRLEILAALANTLLLFAVAAYVVYEAISRLGGDHEVASTPMIAVAILGLVINLVAFKLLAAGAQESLNLRGAYLEVIADAVGSVGVLVGAAIMAATSWYWIDSLIAIGIGIFILPRAYKLGRDALRILVESAPAHVDVDRLAADLHTVPDVVEVHDLHVWTITSGMDAVSVHLQVDPRADTHAVLDRARELLRDRHKINHATVQVEPTDHAGCNLVQW